MNTPQLKQLIELAKQVCADTVSSAEATQRLRQLTHAQDVEADAIHFLYHFMADADIREKDDRYRDDQRRHLLGLIDALKAKLEGGSR